MVTIMVTMLHYDMFLALTGSLPPLRYPVKKCGDKCFKSLDISEKYFMLRCTLIPGKPFLDCTNKQFLFEWNETFSPECVRISEQVCFTVRIFVRKKKYEFILFDALNILLSFPSITI